MRLQTGTTLQQTHEGRTALNAHGLFMTSVGLRNGIFYLPCADGRFRLKPTWHTTYDPLREAMLIRSPKINHAIPDSLFGRKYLCTSVLRSTYLYGSTCTVLHRKLFIESVLGLAPPCRRLFSILNLSPNRFFYGTLEGP
jgi:hypothetical protein